MRQVSLAVCLDFTFCPKASETRSDFTSLTKLFVDLMIDLARLATIHWEAMNMKARVIVAGTLFAIVTALGSTSSRAQDSAQFEAASVKLNVSGQRGTSLPPPKGGRFNAINLPFRNLIEYAYHLQDFQISGAQGWMNSDRY